MFCLLHLVTVCTFDHVVLVRYYELVVVTVWVLCVLSSALSDIVYL